MAGVEAAAYRFRIREIRLFAERYLGLSIDDLDAAFTRLGGIVAPPTRREILPEIDAGMLERGGIIDFVAHAEQVQRVAGEKEALFSQYAKYREQVGYRIGQLETLLEMEHKQRALAEEQTQLQADKLDILKQKLLEARRTLAALEAQEKGHRRWWDRLLHRGQR